MTQLSNPLRWLPALLTGALLAAACGGEPAAPEQDFLPSVLAAQVVSVDLEEQIHASGEIRARNRATIAAEVAGRVTVIRVEEGARVEPGEVVVELDPARRELELEAARARAARAEAKLAEQRRQTERVRSLNRKNIASEAELEEAETALRLVRAEAAAERAELGVSKRQLADASVTAPFAGLVARRQVDSGEFVQPGAELFELVSLDPVELVFHLPELDAGRVRTGQRVGVGVAPYPGRRFEGRVIFVSPTIDPATRTLRIKAELDNPDGVLRPGLFARVDLGVALRSGVVMVPEESVLQRADGPVLFRIDDAARVQRLAVQLGTRRDGLVEVRGGALLPGQRIVRRGHAGLVDGAQVALRDAAGGPDPTEVANGPGDEAGL